jgi:hypothetical protein
MVSQSQVPAKRAGERLIGSAELLALADNRRATPYLFMDFATPACRFRWWPNDYLVNTALQSNFWRMP